jgi:thiosulfate dehydrogenase [quinone] large subunit
MAIARSEPFVLEDPPLAKRLFSDTRMAWIWLPVRLYLGWMWLSFGLKKLADPRWMAGGDYLRTFWESAVKIPPAPARPPIAVDWYREFIQILLNGGHYVWFSKVVVFAELAIGTALILGAFTAIAAFSGGFMNWNFVMAGTASVNGLMFAIATWLVLAWKTAGWIGLDRWLLPMLGTPWRAGRLFQAGRAAAAPAVAPR